MIGDCPALYPCLLLRRQYVFTFVSHVHTKKQLRHANQVESGHFLRTEFVFPPGNTMPMCCLCIPIYLIQIRVATLPGTSCTGPRIQHTRIDTILKEDATNSCVIWLSQVVVFTSFRLGKIMNITFSQCLLFHYVS